MVTATAEEPSGQGHRLGLPQDDDGPAATYCRQVTATAGLAGTRSRPAAFLAGALIGVLGGLIGLGGAEFRLPLLIGLFGFLALQAVILNKAMSLVVVATALPARLFAVPLDDLSSRWYIIANLLAGSLLGAWLGATWATRMRSATLYKVLAALLVLIAIALALSHAGTVEPVDLPLATRIPAGIAAGVGIGIVAALMGIAGGELLIPTIVLLFAVDIKIAGSLSLAVSLPTMLVAFARYSRDGSFTVLRDNRPFVIAMAAGSITGTLVGGLLLDSVPDGVVIPLLVGLLFVSSIKVWTHKDPGDDKEDGHTPPASAPPEPAPGRPPTSATRGRASRREPFGPRSGPNGDPSHTLLRDP